MKISMTSFLDFLVSEGPSRVSQVRRVKQQYEQAYSPASDYYKPVREAVVAMHRDGGDPSDLQGVVDRVHPTRRDHYAACIDGYERWVRHRAVTALRPSGGDWQHDGLTVRVNPELHLVIDGLQYLVKTYWKATPVSKRLLDSALQLMHETCRGHTDGTVAVLDVRRGKLHAFNGEKANMPVYLRAEATTFASLWDQV